MKIKALERVEHLKPKAKKSWYSFKALDSDTTEIFIYDEISFFGVDAKKFVKELSEIETKNILVRINSPGGDMFDGIAIANSLKSHSAHVVTRVEGIAASAASIIAIAGDEVQMFSDAWLMIHAPWTFAIGNAKDFRELADTLDQFTDTLVNTYVSQSNLSNDVVAKMLETDTWIDADTAKDYEFVDSIVDEDAKINDSWDFSIFNNVPDDIYKLKNSGVRSEFSKRDLEKHLRDLGYSQKVSKNVVSKVFSENVNHCDDDEIYGDMINILKDKEN